MIAVLYGRSAAPFVENTVHDICAAAAAAGGEGVVQPLSIEAAIADPLRRSAVRRLYLLPFDLPATARVSSRGDAVADFLRGLFPRVDVVNGLATQDLCWDKVATQQRLLHRGVPVPDTLITTDPSDVLEFVRAQRFAILKERFGCGGHGHVVLWVEDGKLVGDGGSHQVLVEPVASGTRRLVDQRLIYPGPFYLQRLVLDHVAGETAPGQVLRAYVVDGQVVLWTERYREHYRRPSDWIINATRGARYRFVLNVSEEAKKLALRTAEVTGARVAAVDILRSLGGLYVLEVDCDGYHMMIDRQFKHVPEYREFFNVDRYIAESLLVEPSTDVRRSVERNDEPRSAVRQRPRSGPPHGRRPYPTGARPPRRR